MSEIRDFVLLQLGSLPGLTCKPMFGGHGLWQNGIFFGIIYRERLYFRTGTDTAGDYLDAGMAPFATADFTSTNYYEVPPDVQASGAKLQSWADAAVREAMKVKRATRPKRKTRR